MRITTATCSPRCAPAVAEFQGAYAIAAISAREPGRIVGARAGSPLLVGIGEHDHFLASDASALSPVTQRVAYLEEGDVADITREGYAIYDATGARVGRARRHGGKPRATRSSSDRTATSCRRKSSSSRARSPTRSRASAASRRSCSATRAAEVFVEGAARCTCSPAAPATTRAWSGGCGSKAWRAFPRRSRSPANTAIATACPIPMRWSS